MTIEDQGRERPIDLARGWPSLDMLSSHLLSEAAVETLKDPSKYLPALQYGDDAGYGPLRKEIASWISNVDGRAHLPEHICVTAGASLGMASILQNFTDPSITRAVWIVAPAYHLSFGMFKDAGFEDRLISVPEETDGIDLEWLEIQLAKCDEDYSQPYLSTRKPGPGRKFYRHVIYTVPTCANPSGRIMSLTTRSRLVALARKHDALVICDDVYNLLQWPLLQDSCLPEPLPACPENENYKVYPPVQLPQNTALPRLSDLDLDLGPSAHDVQSGTHFGHAISNNSFSKIVGPGTGSTVSGGSPSQLASAIVHALLQSGRLDEHVARCVRPGLQRRHAVLARAVGAHLAPFGVSWVQRDDDGVLGGYFLWLTLPVGSPPATEFAARAEAEEGVLVVPGDLFGVPGCGAGDLYQRSVRLSFAWEDDETFEEAINMHNAT
ncbi:aminotransferase [Verticillium dahliae VdLs.17]|uniref:Aminotransferase n=1 Tax=Verticillium dahliae (strain VdLs.17 / ATCC MYA-4575 / FGSC 10137) TaxID=498257 RepID=G2X0B8_VERDV|nr:aminotransferase [Verticillium dahliae VdLs.17]EGY22259.1 aminotransferase [Verticillium dahliae VdLs.17]